MIYVRVRTFRRVEGQWISLHSTEVLQFEDDELLPYISAGGFNRVNREDKPVPGRPRFKSLYFEKIFGPNGSYCQELQFRQRLSDGDNHGNYEGELE